METKMVRLYVGKRNWRAATSDAFVDLSVDAAYSVGAKRLGTRELDGQTVSVWQHALTGSIFCIPEADK